MGRSHVSSNETNKSRLEEFMATCSHGGLKRYTFVSYIIFKA